MKAIELRQAILQAAVQGKLVAQNPNDEPSTELLRNIQIEKDKLIKEGKVKKEKLLPLISKFEIPHDLPKGWTFCQLNEIVSKVGSGSTPTGGRSTYVSDGIKFLRSQNIYNEGLRLNGVVYINYDIHAKMKNTAVQPKDILLNITGASIGRCCIVNDDFDTGNVNQHVSIIRCIFPALRFFLHVFLTSPYLQKEIMKQQVGVSREGLSGDKIKRFVIPIPPLQEQQRIVAKVDELMMLCDKLEAAEKELETLEEHFAEFLPKSILQLAVQGKLVAQNPDDEPASELLKRIQAEKTKLVKEGKIKKEKPLPPITDEEIPYELPKGWAWCRMGDLFQIASSKRVHQKDWCDQGIPFYRAREIAVLSEYGYVNNELYISQNLYDSFVKSYGVPTAGDLMVTGVGTIGKTYIVKENDVFYYKDASVLCFHNLGNINSNYIKFVMKSPCFSMQLEANSSGTTVDTLTIMRANNYLVPLPPDAEQQRIVAKIEELMQLYDSLKIARIMPVKADNVDSNILQFPAPKTVGDGDVLAIAARGNVADEISPEHQAALDKLLSMMEDDA